MENNSVNAYRSSKTKGNLVYILIRSADPQSRPVVIIIFAHVVRPHFSNLAKQNRKKWSLLARLWVWPRGSLMTHVLSIIFPHPWTFSHDVLEAFGLYGLRFEHLWSHWFISLYSQRMEGLWIRSKTLLKKKLFSMESKDTWKNSFLHPIKNWLVG